MNDDEMIRELSAAVIDPICAVLDGMIALVERLTDRIEVLELEGLNGRLAPTCTPNAPPASDNAEGPAQT